MSGRASQGPQGSPEHQGQPRAVFQPLGDGDPQHVAGYRIAARLGAGGMGKVYLSYTPGGRPVAIKVIRPDFAQDAEFRRRFAQEVHAAQRVQGLYTAPVIDADPDAEQPWLATAYVPGPSLADAVVQHGKLPVETVLLLVAGVAEALQVIHGAGIVHRDLKPANVLLAADGPRVIDFGIARAADATSLTSSGVTIGTPSFMAPEQAAGSTVTPATDIFALGQVAAYASTGRAAFGEGTSHGVLYRIVHEEPDLTGVPEQLVDLVTRCLAKEAEERPSVADLLALCQTASGETVLRRPEEWLPSVVAAEIGTRKAAPAPPVTPPPAAAGAPAQVPAPPTTPPVAPPPPAQAPTAAPPQPAAPPADVPQPAAHEPTAASTPATPPPGFGPAPASAYGYPQPQTAGHPQASAPTVPGAPYGSAPGQPYDTGAGSDAAVPPKKKRGKAIALAVAATLVVGALAGGGAYLALADDDKGDDKARSQQADPTDATDSTDTAPADEPPSGDPGEVVDDQSPPAAPEEPVADPEPTDHNTINLVTEYHLTFGDDPLKPVNDDSSSDLSYNWDLGELEVSNGKLVLLRPGQKAELATCRSETRYAQDLDLDVLPKGSKFCVLTNTGHVGIVTYQGKSPDSDPSKFVTVDVRLWLNAVEVAQPTS
ncbi:protein kinase [Streptomyces sp. NPDC048057]|uniref:serine/threonine-protein kinase n=1 Tax=Streptomyces sp. NPDC048057 TaxID=3155628 RepID=UPI0033C69CFD